MEHVVNTNNKKSPVEIAKEASNLQCKLWENRDLTVRPVITYIYLCEL
jgi:hypothetical protein